MTNLDAEHNHVHNQMHHDGYGDNNLFNQSTRLTNELSLAVKFADTLQVHDLDQPLGEQ